jgi:hypothetical protein
LSAPAAPKPIQHLVDKVARLRRENKDLRLHVELNDAAAV